MQLNCMLIELGLCLLNPEDRELTVSCGTALCYLQIAILHFGFRYKTELLPKSEGQKSFGKDYGGCRWQW